MGVEQRGQQSTRTLTLVEGALEGLGGHDAHVDGAREVPLGELEVAAQVPVERWTGEGDHNQAEQTCPPSPDAPGLDGAVRVLGEMGLCAARAEDVVARRLVHRLQGPLCV